MKTKILFLSIFLLISNLIISQPIDKYKTPIKYKDNICLETGIGTRFKTPTVGLMFEREVRDDQYKFSIPLRVGYWQTLDLTPQKGNYFIIQLGLIGHINKKIDIGGYFMNLQANLPKRDINNPKDFNYQSPFSGFIRLHNPHFPKSQLYFEGSYYNNLDLFSYRVNYTYKLYNIKHK